MRQAGLTHKKEESSLQLRECFSKFKWFFQQECIDCELRQNCKKATQGHRKILNKRLEMIEDAVERDELIKNVYKMFHPKLLDNNYDFFSK